ncbi:MAG: hypothetical protein ABL940_00115 [Bacteroidia bacterium]
MKTTLTITIVLLTLTSCSVQKRMYSPGYNFTWNMNKHNAPKSIITDTNSNKIKTASANDSLVTDDYVASIETKITVTKTEKISLTTVKKTKLNTVKNVVTKLDTVIGTEQDDLKKQEKLIREANVAFSISLGSIFLFTMSPLALIISFVLAKRVLREIDKYPHVTKTKKRAKFAVKAFWVYLIVMPILLVIGIIYFMNTSTMDNFLTL